MSISTDPWRFKSDEQPELTHQEWLLHLVKHYERIVFSPQRKPEAPNLRDLLLGLIVIGLILTSIAGTYYLSQLLYAPYDEETAVYAFYFGGMFCVTVILVVAHRFGFPPDASIWREFLSLLEYVKLVLLDHGVLRTVLYFDSNADQREIEHDSANISLTSIIKEISGIPAHPQLDFRQRVTDLVNHFEQHCLRLGLEAYPRYSYGAYARLAQKGSPAAALRLAVAVALYQELFDPLYTPIKLPKAAQEWLKNQPPVEVQPADREDASGTGWD